MRGVAVVLPLVAAGGVVLVGCGGGGSSSAPAPVSTPPPAAAGTPTAPATTDSVPAAPPPTSSQSHVPPSPVEASESATTGDCQAGQLALTALDQGAAGSEIIQVTARNTGTTCVISGFFGAAAYTADGTAAYIEPTRMGAAEPFTLQAGTSTAFTVQVTDSPQAATDVCYEVTTLHVTPPDQRTTLRVALPSPAPTCQSHGRLTPYISAPERPGAF